RLRDAFLDSGAHVGDRRVDPRHEAVDASQEIFVILPRLERMHAAAGADDREFAGQTAPDLIGGEQMPRLAQTFLAGLEVELEDVVRHAFGLVERDHADSAELTEIACAQRGQPGPVLLADGVDEDAVVLAQTGLARGEGIVRGDVAVVVANEITEPGREARRPRRAGGDQRDGRGGRDADESHTYPSRRSCSRASAERSAGDPKPPPPHVSIRSRSPRVRRTLTYPPMSRATGLPGLGAIRYGDPALPPSPPH